MTTMQLIRGGDKKKPFGHVGCAVSVGAFDGLHLGHQAVLKQLGAQAADRLIPVTVLFEPLPRTYFAERPIPRLQTLRDKLLGLSKLGIQRVVCLRFNREFAAMSAEDFIAEYLVRDLGMRTIVMGEDFRFGYRRLGDMQLLKDLAKKHRFGVKAVPSQIKDGSRISSTQIRTALADGDLKKARRMLGQPYSFSGKIGYGDGRGASLGFPTANLFCGRCSPPLAGVYAAEAYWGRCKNSGRRCVLNAGTRPTFSGRRHQIEVHVPGYAGNLYGQRLRLQLLSRIRSEARFRSAEELRKKIEQDVEAAMSSSW